MLSASCVFKPTGIKAQELKSLPLISVKGNSFVNDKGETVTFQGVSIADPHRLVNADQWKKELFREISGWGANVIRLPVHPRWWRERGTREYVHLLDEAVEWAKEFGLYVIIDWHSIGNLRTELFSRDIYDTSMRETLEFWRLISARYANEPAVAFYEIFNEPTTNNDRLGSISWEQWTAIVSDIITVIKANNPNAIPLVAGFDWAYDLKPVKHSPLPFEGIAYVSHPYPQKRNPPWPPKWEEDFGFVADKYPVFATEFGFMQADERGAHIPVIGDEEYGRTIISYFREKGISWVAWVFDPQWSPQLINDWDYTPTRSGRFFRDVMLGREAAAPGQKPAFYVKGPDIYAPNGEKLIMRGVNKMIFYRDRFGTVAYPEIAKTGANVTRIFWFTSGTAEELDITLTNCIENNMIPMPALWEATGKWDQLEKCVDYWSRPDIAAVIKKHEKYVLLNIANEAGNHDVTETQFRTEYQNAITRLRAAGINTPLVIDAAGWGRRESDILNQGNAILEHDPLKNIIFSWHPWDANAPQERIREAIDGARNRELAFIIGEFSHESVGCRCCIDYEYILDYAQKTGTGWLAWSWGPGNADCASMDMTKDGHFNTLHGWGLEVAITLPASIKNTSVRPGIFPER